MKRILVTGAAGTVGRRTVAELVKNRRYAAVRTFDLPDRKTRRALAPWMGRIEAFYGSVEDADALAAAVKDVDLVIHLAAVIPPLADERPDLVGRVNIWGTHRLIEAMRLYAPEAFLLFASSVAVYGDRLANPWISAGDAPNPSEGDIYAMGKVTAEHLVRRSGLPYSIFRLTGILGPEAAARGRLDPLMFHMPLDTSIEIATAEDAGFALSRAIRHLDELEGRTFNLGGGEACRIRYRELLARTFSLSGIDFRRIDEGAFATRNFHCGYFTDSDELEDILHFRRDTVESYLDGASRSMPGWRRLLVSLTRRHAVRAMMKGSDPLKARKRGDAALMRRFFGAGWAPTH